MKSKEGVKNSISWVVYLAFNAVERDTYSNLVSCGGSSNKNVAGTETGAERGRWNNGTK